MCVYLLMVVNGDSRLEILELQMNIFQTLILKIKKKKNKRTWIIQISQNPGQYSQMVNNGREYWGKKVNEVYRITNRESGQPQTFRFVHISSSA